MKNKFMVGVVGDKVVILQPVSGRPLTADEALHLAGWLVTLAEHNATKSFEDVVKEIQK